MRVDDAAPSVTNAASVSPGASTPSARFLRVPASAAAAASSVSTVSVHRLPASSFCPFRPYDAAPCNAAVSAPAVPADVRAASFAAAVTPDVEQSPARSDHLPSRVARATSPSNPGTDAFGYSNRTDTESTEVIASSALCGVMA